MAGPESDFLSAVHVVLCQSNGSELGSQQAVWTGCSIRMIVSAAAHSGMQPATYLGHILSRHSYIKSKGMDYMNILRNEFPVMNTMVQADRVSTIYQNEPQCPTYTVLMVVGWPASGTPFVCFNDAYWFVHEVQRRYQAAILLLTSPTTIVVFWTPTLPLLVLVALFAFQGRRGRLVVGSDCDSAAYIGWLMD